MIVTFEFQGTVAQALRAFAAAAAAADGAKHPTHLLLELRKEQVRGTAPGVLELIIRAHEGIEEQLPLDGIRLTWSQSFGTKLIFSTKDECVITLHLGFEESKHHRDSVSSLR